MNNFLLLFKLIVIGGKDYTMFFMIIGASIIISIATKIHDIYLKKKKFESFWHNKSINKMKKSKKKKRQKYVNYKTVKPTIIYNDHYRNDFTKDYIEEIWNEIK
ncbi:MAG TPA: hypothetical protein VJZ04_07995 [Lachnospiraceae bacterium]|nr:hypothetical protein [Lachnospiraceae bacterium]